MQIFRTTVSLKKFLLLAGVSAVCVLWTDAAYAASTPGDFLVRRNASDATTNIPDSAVTADLGWDTQVAATGTSITYSGDTFTFMARDDRVHPIRQFKIFRFYRGRLLRLGGLLLLGRGTLFQERRGPLLDQFSTMLSQSCHFVHRGRAAVTGHNDF